MDSELINCMDMLEEELEESKKALFSSSFKKVDTERMYEILEDMRAAYPEELRQAERIISDKMRIMADAKADAERFDAGCGRVFGRIHRYGEKKQRIPIRQRRNTKTCGLTARLFFTLLKR